MTEFINFDILSPHVAESKATSITFNSTLFGFEKESL
jgi:hypothetical protein